MKLQQGQKHASAEKKLRNNAFLLLLPFVDCGTSENLLCMLHDRAIDHASIERKGTAALSRLLICFLEDSARLRNLVRRRREDAVRNGNLAGMDATLAGITQALCIPGRCSKPVQIRDIRECWVETRQSSLASSQAHLYPIGFQEAIKGPGRRVGDRQRADLRWQLHKPV
jgi:hypothetical protein